MPHQIYVEVEPLILEMRRAHPTWGPRTILSRLARQGIDPLPGRSSVHRALVRHRFIDPKRRRRRRSDYKRWERARAMELWQTDITGGVCLAEGTEASIVTGIDDYSRFCVSAKVVARATARPVCDALSQGGPRRARGHLERQRQDLHRALRPEQRRGALRPDLPGERDPPPAPPPTARPPWARSSDSTRHHEARVPRRKVFESIEAAQSALDGWVSEYNHVREHQRLGDRPPVERFALEAGSELVEPVEVEEASPGEPVLDAAPRLTRVVDSAGRISLGGLRYHAGRWLALEPVEVVSRNGLVELHHNGVLIATHVRRHPPAKDPMVMRRRGRPPRAPKESVVVTRKVDNSGSVSFAGANYRAGNAYRAKQVQVSVVGDSVQISCEGKLVRTHAVRHDRNKEHGPSPTPAVDRGGPMRLRTPHSLSQTYRSQSVPRVPGPDKFRRRRGQGRRHRAREGRAPRC